MDDSNTYETAKLNAVKKIQKYWRSYIDKQLFKYYCKLINFKNQGDPSMMLKCINPREIELFDSAFGAKVKFRFGGEKFPPNIYFKVFTFRPIQDICANSPKDYSKVRRQIPRFVHNKSGERIAGSRDAWYHRVENNGWRQVSDGMLTKILQDPITLESAGKAVPFNCDYNKRRQDKKNLKKKRKLEWLKKIYNFNLLEVKEKGLSKTETDIMESKETELTDTMSLVKRAAASMIDIFDKKGEEYIEDWAVDELLDWTSGLSFEEYSNDWNSLATSLGSDWKLNLKRQVNHPMVSDQSFVNYQINQTSEYNN